MKYTFLLFVSLITLAACQPVPPQPVFTPSADETATSIPLPSTEPEAVAILPGDIQKACTCAPAVVTKCQKRISGPMLDRKVPRARGGIDIHTLSRMVLAGSKSRAWTMKS